MEKVALSLVVVERQLAADGGTGFAPTSWLERLHMAKARTASPIFILQATITAIAALYFAKSILLPIALAILLSFLLTPLTDRLERWYVPRVLAVLLVVGMCFAIMVGLGYIITNQLVDLTKQLTSHRENLVEKVRWFGPSKAILR
jgi:predicted PurR-regulated permease PerM